MKRVDLRIEDEMHLKATEKAKKKYLSFNSYILRLIEKDLLESEHKKK